MDKKSASITPTAAGATTIDGAAYIRSATTEEVFRIEADYKDDAMRTAFDEGISHSALEDVEFRKPRSSQSIRSRVPRRTNSFSAHFTEFINRRREALETERHEISVYTSPLTVLSYFVLYILHEFRMALLWIISQQYLLVLFPVIAATVYFLYQTNGAHQP
ncbi:hypothetical protein BGZ54_002984, partial [Gamsiella multidivaricata]